MRIVRSLLLNTRLALLHGHANGDGAGVLQMRGQKVELLVCCWSGGVVTCGGSAPESWLGLT